MTTPHGAKLIAALGNPKCPKSDRELLGEAKKAYDGWRAKSDGLTSKGRARVNEMVALLNAYKDFLEVELVARRGSPFLKRQKGQLKLDGSVIEEFLPMLLRPEVVPGISRGSFVAGPRNAFMSLSFRPRDFAHLGAKPELVVKEKDQDFVIGSRVHYRFSASPDFAKADTECGDFTLAVVAAECKVNLDKTMFQEAAGTAARLKQGCPVARYYVLVEYLDMTPEDTRLTSIDNVYLLRKARRLPFDRRDDPNAVAEQHAEHPIAEDVVWRFVKELQGFVGAAWYDPDDALKRGTFVP